MCLTTLFCGTLQTKGLRSIRDSPKRAEGSKNVIEKAGGKLSGTYYTFGKYDGISIVEASDDAIIMSSLLSVESQGNARTLTLKAFTYDEATKLIEKL
jgi:uncharacterized protein with GYD domain